MSHEGLKACRPHPIMIYSHHMVFRGAGLYEVQRELSPTRGTCGRRRCPFPATQRGGSFNHQRPPAATPICLSSFNLNVVPARSFWVGRTHPFRMSARFILFAEPVTHPLCRCSRSHEAARRSTVCYARIRVKRVWVQASFVCSRRNVPFRLVLPASLSDLQRAIQRGASRSSEPVLPAVTRSTCSPPKRSQSYARSC